MGHGASLPQEDKLRRLVAIKMFMARITVQDLRRKFQRFDADRRGVVTVRLAEHLLGTVIDKSHLNVSAYHIQALAGRFVSTKSRSLFDYHDCCAWLMRDIRAGCETEACVGPLSDSSGEVCWHPIGAAGQPCTHPQPRMAI